MFLFGGMLLHAIFSPTQHSIVVLWTGLQKAWAFRGSRFRNNKGDFWVASVYSWRGSI